MGWGFSPKDRVSIEDHREKKSQSLSGWDGVFHRVFAVGRKGNYVELVAIPFRVGWGFSLTRFYITEGGAYFSRNPFQGGMGFFTSKETPEAGAMG